MDNKLLNEDIKNIKYLFGYKAGRVISEQEEPETDRYMFFSNLEQIHRQIGILLEKDPKMISDILENGHDWAQDHIATAKESIDQVFDFLMNMEKGDGEQDIEDNSFDVM
jgi:prephenate dehydrogenase